MKHQAGPTLIRATDVIVAGTLVIFFAPLCTTLALGILVLRGRPVIIRDRAYGEHGRPIRLLRFRSGTDAMSDPPTPDALALLPRLFNVLKGDLSMVGPPPRRWPSPQDLDAGCKPGLVPTRAGEPLSYGVYWRRMAVEFLHALRS